MLSTIEYSNTRANDSKDQSVRMSNQAGIVNFRSSVASNFSHRLVMSSIESAVVDMTILKEPDSEAEQNQLNAPSEHNKSKSSIP